jgi:hypothetical protein
MRPKGGRVINFFIKGTLRIRVNRETLTVSANEKPLLIKLFRGDEISAEVIGKEEAIFISIFIPPLNLEEIKILE